MGLLCSKTPSKESCASFSTLPNATSCAPFFPDPVEGPNASNCAPFFPPSDEGPNASNCAPFFPTPTKCQECGTFQILGSEFAPTQSQEVVISTNDVGIDLTSNRPIHFQSIQFFDDQHNQIIPLNCFGTIVARTGADARYDCDVMGGEVMVGPNGGNNWSITYSLPTSRAVAEIDIVDVYTTNLLQRSRLAGRLIELKIDGSNVWSTTFPAKGPSDIGWTFFPKKSGVAMIREMFTRIEMFPQNSTSSWVMWIVFLIAIYLVWKSNVSQSKMMMY